MSRAMRRFVLTVDEVRREVEPLLAERLSAYGFRQAEVRDETDFDGEPVIGVAASVQTAPPAKVMIDALAELRTKLLSLGEERFVFLRTQTPDRGPIDEDEDE